MVVMTSLSSTRLDQRTVSASTDQNTRENDDDVTRDDDVTSDDIKTHTHTHTCDDDDDDVTLDDDVTREADDGDDVTEL